MLLWLHIEGSLSCTVQERAEELLEAAEAECRAIMNLFAVQLVKLPKAVRKLLLFICKYEYPASSQLLDET
jgi:hypothetical protein